MKWYLLPLLLVVAALSLFAITLIADPDHNYHPICGKGGAPANCFKPEEYVQSRLCYPRPPSDPPLLFDDPRRNPCFGTANDGWDTDRLGVRKGLWREPFEYATIEYRTETPGRTQHWQKEQVDAVVARIGEIVRSKKQILLVAFVHGWHHSAQEDRDGIAIYDDVEYDPKGGVVQDGNLLYFKHILAKAKHELEARNDFERAVLGVYIGWNAGGPDAYLNLGSRARAADRLGNSDDFAADMQSLEHALNPDPKDSTSNKMLVLGHSLGGRVLSRYMLRQISEEHSWEPLGFQSLVTTINPAIAADAFDDIMETPTDHKNPLPSWINLTSKDDQATGFAFRIAAVLGRATFVTPGVSDKVFARSAYSAIGHFGPYQTHYLQMQYEPSADVKEPCHDANCVYGCPVKRAENEELFRNLPSLGRERQTLWYEAKGIPRPLFFLNGAGCSSKFYFTTLSPTWHPVPGRLWNVTTDHDTIDIQPGTQTSFARHNAFVQTSLVRMLLELLFAKQPAT